MTRIAVYGAGGVGGYFGARLARAGAEVHFIARGAHLHALREHGLKVRSVKGDFQVQAQATDDPADIGPCDFVLFCVKSFDTDAAAARLGPLVGAGTAVISLQNGIENEDVIARELGLPPLMIALTRIGVALTAPATIEYSGRGTIVFGEPDGSESPRARRAAAAFAVAGVPHQFRRDILVAAWEKLAWNAGFNAVTTLTGSTVGDVLAQAGSRTLVVAAMEEVDAVAVGLGIPVRRSRTARVVDDSVTGLPDFQTSMLQDLLRGGRLEHDALNGAVVRAAAHAGVPVPVNRMLLALLSRLDPAARQPT